MSGGGPAVSRINVELATGTARTGMMRLTYDAAATGGWIDYDYGSHHTNKDFASIRSLDDEWIVQFQSSGMGICRFGWGSAPRDTYWMQVSFHIKKDGIRNLGFRGKKLSFDFEGDNREVLGKVSMSYVSKANARENVETEVPGWDFEEQKEQGRKAWNYYLSKIAINDFDDADHDKSKVTDRWSVFYSALYRSLLHMDVSNDVNGDYLTYNTGNPRLPDNRPYNVKVRNLESGSYYDYGSSRSRGSAEAAGRYGPAQRVRFTNFSGWDVYRSQMALVGLVAPAVAGDMAQSLVHSGVEWSSGDGRDIPRWTAGEIEWGMMKGDPGPPSVSSLYFFSQGNLRSLPITLDVFDYSSRERREHYSGAPRNATSYSNRVMEGMGSDAAISQFAFRLSQMQGLPEELRKQAWELYVFSVKQVNDNLARLMVGTSRGYPRGYRVSDSRGDIMAKWHKDLEEGNPIQYGFMPNHDVRKLKELIDAGEKAGTFIERDDIADESRDSDWDNVVAAARREGNEDEGNSLRELQVLFNDIKQYALARWDADERSMAMRFMMHFMDLNSGEDDTMHAFLGNEVQHAVPYLGNWFEPHLTQDVVRRALNFGFRNADWGLYGNDDLGATSSFYVWSALGIYPVIAGVGGVTLVAPSFREGEVSLPDGRSIRILANKESMQDRFVRSMTRDGRLSSNLWISAQELLRGTELVFDIGTTRSRTWGEGNSDAPPSYRTAESPTPTGYRSIWREEGDESTGGSSHSAFDGDQQSAWHFLSETDGSKVLEVEFTSVYAASGLLLRHADVGRTSTLNSDLSNVTVSVAVKGSDGSWSDVATTKTVISWIDVTTGKTVHDTRRMLLDFDAGEVEIHGLRLTFAGLDVNEEHGIYEVLAKDGRVVRAEPVRSRRGLLEESLGDGVSWFQLSVDPVLSVGGMREQFQVTAGRTLVLRESHISVKDLDTRVSATGSVDASRITLRVRDVVGGVLQKRTSLSAPWVAMDLAAVYSFSLADLRAGKIGFLAGDGANDITFTIQAEDDDGNLSDSNFVRSGEQPASVRIPVVGLEKVSIGETSSVNSDGALTPDVATLNRWRGAAVGGALTILVELHGGLSVEELLLGSHGVTSITSSWIWDAQSGIGTLSLEGDSTATALNFRAMLDVLQLRSAVGASEGHRRILVRPDISGSAFRKDFHVREVKVYVNDAPSAPASGLDDHAVKEDVASDHVTATYRVPAFTDDEDTELRYEAKLVVVGRNNEESLLGLPKWMSFDGSPGSRTFTFTPDKSWHAGEYRLRVTATDSGGLSDSEDFVVAVAEVNDAPKAPAVGLSDHTVTEDESAVTYQVPKFADEEDDAARKELTYVAQLVQGGKAGALPKWVTFDAGSRTFTFTPDKSWHAGKYTLRVRGTDSGGLSDSVDFVVTVKDVNDAPIASPLKDQKVAEDVSATYRFPAFTDEETPSSGLVYSAHLLVFPSSSAGEILFEGSPASEEGSSGSEGSVRSSRDSSVHTEASLPDWISFDGSQHLFRFSPKTGAHVGRHVLRVRARDASGKTETEDFTLHVSATNDAPEAEVSMDGFLQEGRVVHLRVVGLSDEDGVPSSSMSPRYRWYESSEPEVQSSWSLIAGAEGASFRVGSGQADKYLRGVFSYTDSGGTRERVFAQSEEVVRRKSLPAVVVPIFGGEKESSSSSVSVFEEGEALEMVSRSLSQAQERLSLMRNRRGSGSGAWSFPPPRFSFPSVLSEPRVQPPTSQGSGAQVPQSPQAQGTTTQQSDGAPSQPSSQPPASQGGGVASSAEPTSAGSEQSRRSRGERIGAGRRAGRDTLAQHPCLTKDRPTLGHGAPKRPRRLRVADLCASLSPRHPRRDHVYLGRRGRRATLACGGRTDGNLRASPCRAVDGRRRGTDRDSGFSGGTSL